MPLRTTNAFLFVWYLNSNSRLRHTDTYFRLGMCVKYHTAVMNYRNQAVKYQRISTDESNLKITGGPDIVITPHMMRLVVVVVVVVIINIVVVAVVIVKCFDDI